MSTPSPSPSNRAARRDIKGDKRRGEIMELLASGSSGNMPVADLAETFGVSVATIRRDLTDLEERALITRTYGGAALLHPRAELSMDERASSHASAKRAIGRAAAQMVDDDELVILDAGSTTEQVALAIGDRHVTVVTNGVRVINRLAPLENVRVLVLGGALRGINETITGPDTEEMLQRVFAAYAFLGADGIDPKRGIASRTYEQSRVKSMMMRNAAKVVIVADSSKLVDQNFRYWSSLPDEWTLITDHEADRDALATLRDSGSVSVITT